MWLNCVAHTNVTNGQEQGIKRQFLAIIIVIVTHTFRGRGINYKYMGQSDWLLIGFRHYFDTFTCKVVFG